MQSEIVAKVTEEPTAKRPTLYMRMASQRTTWEDGSHEYESGCISENKPTPDSFELLITIPGELESARIARIEQARDKVIRLAGDCAGTYAPLRDALQALAAVGKEGK
jgi:hypothetical protein